MKENFKKTKKRFLPLMSALALAVRIAVTENLKKIPNHMKQKTIVPALPFLLPSLFGVGVFYAVPFAVSVFFTFTQGWRTRTLRGCKFPGAVGHCRVPAGAW